MDIGQFISRLRRPRSEERVYACIIHLFGFCCGHATSPDARLTPKQNRPRRPTNQLIIGNHYQAHYGLTFSPEIRQRILDSVVATHTFNNLLESQSNTYHRVRLLAAAAPHSGDWLHAMPTSACGLRLPDEAMRIAVGLHWCISICRAHRCSRGSAVDPLIGTRAFVQTERGPDSAPPQPQ
jgi:hypothetical protein